MRRHRRRIAGLGAFALLAGPAAAPALAQDASVEHRQSVLTELDADGTIRTARYFTQLNVAGGDALSVSDQPTAGLRNLEGFGGVDRDGDGLSYPAGFSRTVANFDGDQPVSIEVSYRLDGEPVRPPDLVGRSGQVEVTYRISNDTAVSQELEFKDATGVWRTETVDVAVPMVGSLSLDLGEHFTDISAPGAVTVGDGRGDTRLQWSLLLFAPLGSEVVEATWTAQVEDATVPAVRVQVLPVDKTSFGSLASTEAAYRSASDDTYALTQGAIKIDRSLSRLASGAASLLDGLGQLKDGAAELAGGLTAAVDGSAELSSGLGRLATGADDLREGVTKARNGSDDLAEGLGKLDAGAGQLSTGLSSASAGGAELATGLKALDGGAAQVLAGLEELKAGLNAPDGLPKAIAGVEALKAGVNKGIAGIGSATTTDTLLYGLDQIVLGLDNPSLTDPGLSQVIGQLATGIATIRAGVGSIDALAAGLTTDVGTVNTDLQTAHADIDTQLTTLAGEFDETVPGDDAIIEAIEAIQADLSAAGATVATQTAAIMGGPSSLTTIRQTAGGLSAGLGPTPADCAAALLQAGAEIASPLGKPSVATTLALVGCELQSSLLEIEGKLIPGVSNPAVFDKTSASYNPTCADTTETSKRCGLLQGLQLVAGGLDLLGIGLSDALAEVNAGLGSTTEPGETLLFGLGQISAGATTASTGAGALSDGLFQLDDGAAQLAAGADAAATGAGDLADGLGQIEDGAGQLATGAKAASDGGSQLAAGLPDAQDGAQQIADGLTMANIGGGQIADGASELGSRGTSVLADQVNEAAAGTNKLVAQLVAVDQRGRTEALPYPAAEGAVASVVYQYDLAGIETTGMGESGRAVVAIGLLGAAGGLGILGRRRLTGI